MAGLPDTCQTLAAAIRLAPAIGWLTKADEAINATVAAIARVTRGTGQSS